jgi:hypothetical protein
VIFNGEKERVMAILKNLDNTPAAMGGKLKQGRICQGQKKTIDRVKVLARFACE